MKIIIAGASGMVGSLVLNEAIQDNRVSEIISLVRRNSNNSSSKIREIVVADFADLSAHASEFNDIYAAYFCIGVYTGSVPNDQFKVITFDYAEEFGRAVTQNSPDVRVCLLSGQGADRKEKSRIAFAKFKGMAENALAKIASEFHSFRPGYIYPVTPRKEPSFMYRLSRTLYPLFKIMGKNMSIKSTELAKVIYHVGMNGSDMEVMENRDMINYFNEKI